MAKQRDYAAEYKARNERAQAAGFKSYSDLRKERSTNTYQGRWEKAQKKGVDRDKFDRKTAEIRKLAKDREKEGKKIYKGKKGKFAKILVEMGVREEEDWWDVGDTPAAEEG